MKQTLFKKLAILILINFNAGLFAQIQQNPEITVNEIKEHISILASDSLKGRKPGTPGGKNAADYIRSQFKTFDAGLLGDDGFQYFNVVTEVKTGDNNFFSFKKFEGKLNLDFVPYSFSKNDELKASVVFVGYGFGIDNDSIRWNDYENIDVSDKWVIILRGTPDINQEENKYLPYADDRDKVLTARDKGAAGVLFVTGAEIDKEDNLVSLYFDKTKSNSGLPVINIKRNITNKILEQNNQTIENLEKQLNISHKSASFEVPVIVYASTEILQKIVQTQNVVAMIEGNDPVLKNEFVVIGAHYDHLGMGGPGSGSRMPDTNAVHNGADDNASGVAGIIEIAEKLEAHKNELKRSVIVMAFGAEEMGLLGSKYFTANPLTDLENIKTMINFDMIGRLNPESKAIVISGTGTSVEAVSILDNLAEGSKIKLRYSPEGYGPSDHASFYAENIPVFFITTGAHADYHTPFDDIEIINFEGQKLVAEFSYNLILDIINRPDNLTFKAAGQKKKSKYGKKLKVKLGIMPDFTSAQENGLAVGGVTPGKPAESAGMLKDDLIIAIEGKPVKNIYDYMNRLKKFEPGQIITVDIIRNGEKKVLLVNL